MGREKYTEEFRRRVGTAAMEEGATLKSIGEKFGVHPTLVRNWKLKYSIADEIGEANTTKELSLAVENMVYDDVSSEDFETLLLADWQDVEAECEEHGEEMDYLVEQALEGLTKTPASSLPLADRVAEYWLTLDDVNGSEPFEIKVRCAEFLATLNRYNDIPNADIQSLAHSNIWTDRLVAGWTVRVRDDDFSSSLKGLLSKDPFEDDNGKVRDTGKIIYASMFVNGEELNLYNFKYKNHEDYYDIKGKSITKSLMKTPINGARLSSSFGMRKHPILGYNKMHRGTDFAAPSGTPIMASGSGTVTRARWCGGGGNCVKIKHNSSYETVYAHMKAFAKGIKEGRKVKQGQIIGYVGSTGLSTGPHLHYEVIVNGKKVNSQRLKLPSGKTLRGEEREEFELKRIKIDLKLSELR